MQSWTDAKSSFRSTSALIEFGLGLRKRGNCRLNCCVIEMPLYQLLAQLRPADTLRRAFDERDFRVKHPVFLPGESPEFVQFCD